MSMLFVYKLSQEINKWLKIFVKQTVIHFIKIFSIIVNLFHVMNMKKNYDYYQ